MLQLFLSSEHRKQIKPKGEPHYLVPLYKPASHHYQTVDRLPN